MSTESASTPDVDVIVPVHSSTRPVDALADSVLDTNKANVRITFVCHNIAARAISERLGARASDPRVRLLEFTDSARSPAGPFNHGLNAATAPFVTKIDSDDTLDAGALDAWLAVQSRTGADIVMARMVFHESGREIPTPPTRPAKHEPRDPVRDRLAYRTSVMGLVSRDNFLTARSAEGLESGEDILQSIRLWFGAERLVLADYAPAYRVHGGSVDRVTAAPRSVAGDFAWLKPMLADLWFQSLDSASKRSIALKLIRIHLMGAVENRALHDTWQQNDAHDLAEAAQLLVVLAGGSVGELSRADHRLLDAIRRHSGPVEFARLSAKRKRASNLELYLPRTLRLLFTVEAPPRLIVAFWLATRRGMRARSA